MQLHGKCLFCVKFEACLSESFGIWDYCKGEPWSNLDDGGFFEEASPVRPTVVSVERPSYLGDSPYEDTRLRRHPVGRRRREWVVSLLGIELINSYREKVHNVLRGIPPNIG